MSNVTTYKISFGSQLNSLQSLIIINGAFVAIYLYIFGSNFIGSIFWPICIITMVVSVIPTLLLHFNYLIYNSKSSLTVDTSKKQTVFSKGSERIVFDFIEIDSIEYISSYGKGVTWYTFEAFRYCRIKLKNEREIFVTNLMMYRLEKEMKELFGRELIKKYKLLCFI